MKMMLRRTDEEMIADFRTAGLAYGKGAEAGDSRKANMSSQKIKELKKEIFEGGDLTKAALLKLLEDPEPWVRFAAAASSLELAPDRALLVLTQLRSLPMSIGAAAFACLRMWETGAPRA